MAYCEGCESKGHDPRTLVVVQKGNEYLLVGPCCLVRQQTPQPPDVEYGLEISSHYGLIAYAKYGGLKLEYRKSPEQLQNFFSGQKIVEQPMSAPTVEVMNGTVIAQA